MAGSMKSLDRDYVGELAEPIYQPPLYLGMLYEKAATEAARDEIERRRRDKLLLLFDHYEIRQDDENSWRKLATALAMKHVRGMHAYLEEPPKTKVGAKKIWPAGRGDELMLAVEAIRIKKDVATSQRGHPTIRGAIKELHKEDKDRKKWGQSTWEALEARHREAKKRARTRVEIGSWMDLAEERGLFGEEVSAVSATKI
jgi:hypothetical protein